MKRNPIDLSHQLMPQNLAFFFTRKDASAFAMSQGWYSNDVLLLRWRFVQGWYVGQNIPGILRLLDKNGQTVEVSWSWTGGNG